MAVIPADRLGTAVMMVVRWLAVHVAMARVTVGADDAARRRGEPKAAEQQGDEDEFLHGSLYVWIDGQDSARFAGNGVREATASGPGAHFGNFGRPGADACAGRLCVAPERV
jgi:hypothetical protein